jgi:hypothetical protein
LINSPRSGIRISVAKQPGKLFAYSDLCGISKLAWLKNYIEAMRPAADADSAMAFFYRPLNSWVLNSSISASHAKNQRQVRYVRKEPPPCKIPADIQTEITK